MENILHQLLNSDTETEVLEDNSYSYQVVSVETDADDDLQKMDIGPLRTSVKNCQNYRAHQPSTANKGANHAPKPLQCCSNTLR